MFRWIREVLLGESELVKLAKERLALEEERLLLTTQMMTRVNQTLEFEKKNQQTLLEIRNTYFTLQELITESAIDQRVDLANVLSALNRIQNVLPVDRLPETLQARFDEEQSRIKQLTFLLRSREKLKEKEAKLTLTTGEAIELEDIELKIEQIEAELEQD